MALFPGPGIQDDHRDEAAFWIKRLIHYHPSLAPHLRDLLDVVVAHIPQVIAAPVLHVPTTEPIGLSLEGTVMFADIDGFTPLAERFSGEASEKGAEELTELVNRFLAILISITSRYGGDLQKFGGDAGMVLFQGEAHALRATAAAQDVQRAMRAQMGNVETSLGRFPLQIAIGLGSGRLTGVGLGNQDGRDWLLIGAPLAAMGEAQMAAPPGETLLARETWEACGGAVEALPVEGDFYQVVTVQPPVSAGGRITLSGCPDLEDDESIPWLLARLDALSPYLAPGLLERLVTAPTLDRLRLWSEYRQVTVMMLSLPDFPDVTFCWGDEERLQQALEGPSAAFVQIRDAVLRYDGIVNKLGIGPTGPYGMVLFGAPQAHEDDPLRAVMAALELQETFNGALRFGINTGYVFAGDLGTAERREYTVMGDEVNLAHRLMSKCQPGEIWLGPSTYQHTAVRYRVTGELGAPTQFKGKSGLIEPFVVRGLRRAPLGASATDIPIVGREEELEQLLYVLQAAKSGKVSMVLLHGEAGVGKSHLVQELGRAADALGFAVHCGVAPSYGAHLPLAAWEAILLSLFDLDAVPLEERPAALSVALARYDVGQWAALLAPLMGLELPPSPDFLDLPANLREAKRQEALCDLWRTAAQQQPQLLIFENAHWMSATSLELLDGLLNLQDQVPLVIVITYREEAGVSARWRTLSQVLDFRLDPLPPKAVATLVQHLFQGMPLPAEVSKWIVERSRGLPLFATEAVRALMDSGTLHRQGDTWELRGSLAEFPLPDMVYSLIQSRIDQLPPPSRHLLRAASVVGDDMTLSMLTAAYGDETESAVRRRIPQLLPFGLVPRDTGGEVLFFHQPLVREVAYRGLTQHVKQHIHQRLAEYLDYSRDLAMPNWLSLLAYHTLEGQLWEKAVQSNLELGRRALHTYLVPQALTALQNALVAVDKSGQELPDARFEAQHSLGEAFILMGEGEEALQHLEQARRPLPAVPTAPADSVRVADLEYHQATVFELQGDYERALEMVVHGLTLSGVEKTIEGLRLYLMGADIFRRQGKYQEAQSWVQRSVALSTHFSGSEAQQLRSRAMYMLALLASLQRLNT